MEDLEFQSKLKKYLVDNLSINITEEGFGFNGRCATIELKLDRDTISSDSYTIKQDDD